MDGTEPVGLETISTRPALVWMEDSPQNGQESLHTSMFMKTWDVSSCISGIIFHARQNYFAVKITCAQVVWDLVQHRLANLHLLALTGFYLSCSKNIECSDLFFNKCESFKQGDIA